MRTAAAVFGGVVLAVLAAAATGQTPADKSDPPDLPRLIADLGSPDFRTREKAGERLAAVGDQALPEMQKVLARTDNPELARRLSVLVRQLEHDRLVSPRRVTLSVKNKSAQTVIDDIAKQTGYRIHFGGAPGDHKYSFDFDRVPFWEAIDKVANAVGLVVYADGSEDGSIQMYGQDTYNPHVAYAGPFRVVATQIGSSRNLQLSGLSRRGFNNAGRPLDSVNLSLQIHSEPKNPILGATQAEVISAADETGASLVPPKEPNQSRSHYYGGSYRTHSTYANLNLVRFDKAATRVANLRAKVGIIMLAGTQPEVVVADPLKVKTKKFVGRTTEVEFDSLTDQNNGSYSLSVTLRKLGASDDGNQDYNWSNNLWQRMELYDDKGNKLRNFGANSTNNDGTAVKMTVQFGPADGGGFRRPAAVAAKAGPPARFVFNEWVTVTHEVTFEFKDLPLP